MVSFVATTAAYLTAGVLILSGVSHILQPDHLVSALFHQRTLGLRTARIAALLVGPVELSLGGFSILSLSGITSMRVSALTLASITCLFLAYTAYLSFLLRRRPGTLCGCTASLAPVSGWSVARTGVLALFALAAWILRESVLTTQNGITFAICLTASVLFAFVLYAIPDALQRAAPHPEGTLSS
jgi:hypothetical protein